MEVIYKTLFEINLLNEYFLTGEDGSTLLNEANPVTRQQLLEQAFEKDKESMTRDIEFIFPPELEPGYENYGLKILPSYGGCRVVVRVSRKILPDQSVVFQPFLPFPPSLELFIIGVKKNNLPDIYSNSRITRAVPSNYFFSNENIPDARVFPFLVNAAPNYVVGRRYEQGDLVIDNTNKLQEVYYDNSGNRLFSEVKTVVKKFAGENDRMLVPLKFNFTVINSSPVTQANFTLKDKLGNVIKTFSFTQTETIRTLWLDFSDKADLLQLSGNLSMPDAIFSLEASGNNGYTESRKLVFDDLLYSTSNWAVVHVKPSVSNVAFNLFANDGYIVRRQNPAGVWTDAPVFEIPVKSRLGHFRYLNNKGKKLDLIPALNSFLNQENDVLISLMPVSLSHYYFLVPDNGSTTTKYLPNPVSYDMKRDDKHRIFFDVFVPESNLFPIVP